MKNFEDKPQNIMEHSLMDNKEFISMLLTAVINVFKSNRTGGFLTVQIGETIGTVPFGIIPDEKLEKYHRLSREKAARLLANIEAGMQIETSYATRNEEMDQWGGAIYPPNGYLVSFSGLSEAGDETLSFLYAIYKGWINPEYAIEISNAKEQLKELIDILF
jgi:hypothetical protein